MKSTGPDWPTTSWTCFTMAAPLHDIGHLLTNATRDASASDTDLHHEERGEQWL